MSGGGGGGGGGLFTDTNIILIFISVCFQAQGLTSTQLGSLFFFTHEKKKKTCCSKWLLHARALHHFFNISRLVPPPPPPPPSHYNAYLAADTLLQLVARIQRMPGADTRFCVRGGINKDGNGGVPLQTSQGVWESAVSYIISAPKTLATGFLFLHRRILSPIPVISCFRLFIWTPKT